MDKLDPEVVFILKTLLYSLFPTLITLIITERIKGRIKNSFDSKIESVKKEHALEISKFQTELNALKAKENFKFTKLHEKRMEVLENTYKLLNDALHHLNQLVVPFKQIGKETTFEQNEELLFEKFRNAQNLFAGYYADKRIYFDEELEELIDSYNSEAITVYNDYSENHFMKQFGEISKETTLKASFAYKKIPEKIIPIKKEIEKKFKELLEH